MKPVIEINHISYQYPNAVTPALEDISLSILPGTFTAILGSNGSGKSTLAKHLNAILIPTGGRVLVDGLDTAAEENLLSIRRRVGMVFQNPDNQIVANVVEDDVAFAPENLGIAPGEIRQRVDNALRQVGMYDFRMHAPHLLSGGQKQRVAIAGVLAMDPELLILDEPTSGLDPQGREELLENLFRWRADRGRAILLVTHDMTTAARCDRLLVMDGGRLVMTGTPEDIFARADELQAMGLALPEAARIALLLREQGIPLPASVYTLDRLRDCLLDLWKEGGASC